MHNGEISDFISICRDMVDLMDKDAYGNISGSTDSEHFAALYITYLTGGKGKASWEKQYTIEQMRDAMRDAVGTVVKLQRKNIGDKAEPNSLNLCATDGSQIVAFRFRNHDIEQPPSLYYSTKAGVTLNRKYPDQYVMSFLCRTKHRELC
jgi:glutamine amidotransferase